MKMDRGRNKGVEGVHTVRYAQGEPGLYRAYDSKGVTAMPRKLVYQPAHNEGHDGAHDETHDAEARQEGEVRRENLPDATPGQKKTKNRQQRPASSKGLYRPLKQRVTIRLDADVIEWFKAKARERGQERGYQTLINKALRDVMLKQE